MANPLDVGSRLYLEDPGRLDFEARVVERLVLPDGSAGVVLDRTCFYPTSGGQPHDTGTLDGEPVVEVGEDEGGRVVHRLRRAPAAEVVRGLVDGARRRDHMQQHSGQHLLSATCLVLLGRETLSFHLGGERCSIDLPGEPPSAADLDRVERRANDIVWEGRPVHARMVPVTELQALRKAPPAGVDAVRVVEIEDWDASACCGTHVRRTSEIGLVKLLATERLGRGTRLHFVCGRRALEECARAQHCVDDLVRLLTCHAGELAAKCSQMLADLKSARKERTAIAAELAATRAAAWVASAPRLQGTPLVVRRLEGDDLEALAAAAQAIAAAGAVALLGMRAGRAQLLFQRPPAVAVDLRPVMQAACGLLDGKGGGRPDRVQGSGTRVEALDAALAAAREALIRQAGEDPAAF